MRIKPVCCYDLATDEAVKQPPKHSAYTDAYDAANERKQEYMAGQRERLCRRLNELMAEQHVTISQVRRDAGICFNTLKQIADGEPINVTVGTVWALANYFNVDMTEFL